MESFCFVFLGLSEFPSISGKENKSIQDEHKYIDPGLNYRISCENENCYGNQKLVIVKRGYGEVLPNIDILKNNDTKLLKCSFCDSLVNQTTSIKGMILFQAEAKILFKLYSEYCPATRTTAKNVSATGKNYKIFGDDNIPQKYESIVMNISKSSRTHYNTVAGLTLEMFKTIKYNEPPEGLFSKQSNKLNKSLFFFLIGYIKQNNDFIYSEMTLSSDYIINKEIQNFPYNIERCSHVLEHKPSEPSEHNPTTTFEFKIDPVKRGTLTNEKLRLFERRDIDSESNDDSILNYWTAHSSVEESDQSLKFELKSFFYAFLGSLDSNQFKLIKPGLNYLLTCNMPIEDCPRRADLMIINREFGKFEPCNDINKLKCPYCDQIITYIDSIKSFIVYKSTGRIDFRFKKFLRVKRFSITNNKIGFFTYNRDMRNLEIEVRKNEI